MMRNNNDLCSMMELAWSFSSNSAILARLASRPDPREELPGGLKWIKPTIKEQLSAIGQTLETLGKGTEPDWSTLPPTLETCCELVMASIACQMGAMPSRSFDTLVSKASDLLSENLESVDTNDLHTWHVYRELYHLMAICHQHLGNPEKELQFLSARKDITCQVMDNRPDLVGSAFVQYGDALVQATYQKHTGALWHYWAVAEDLKYLVSEIDGERFPQAERHTALTWLVAAWEKLAIRGRDAIDTPPHKPPEFGKFDQHLKNLTQQLTERGINERYDLPRLGILGHLYLDETHYTAHILNDLLHEPDDNPHLQTRRLNHRFGVSTRNLSTFNYAIDRYYAKQVLGEIQVVYDQDLSLPFAAMELL